MEQFNLDTWLQDKSRKVVTRDGRPVRIICWDLPGEYKIVGLTDESDDGYTVINKKTDGIGGVSTNDLFFADEENKLTEFEEAVKQVMWTAYNYDDCSNGKDVDDISNVKATSKTLLDLARRELQPELDKKLKESYNQGGLDTQEEITKCLPKWKKVNVFVSNEFGLATRDNDLIITRNGYQIKLSDLMTLPKEE